MHRRLVFASALLVASPAYAHFKLNQPANWSAQSSDGSPQKTAPCGNEGAAADAGMVTEYKVGSMITIAVDETVPHPGHYRVSIAADQASLPADPDGDVKADMTSQCGSLAISASPAMPLIGDGLIAHTNNRTGPQTMQVKLPDGMLCDKCVLQVVEFMSNHGAPCFYHHCANIKISATGPVGGNPGSGSAPTSDPPTGDDAPPAGGTSGGCAVGGSDVAGAALLALAVGLIGARRRRA